MNRCTRTLSRAATLLIPLLAGACASAGSAARQAGAEANAPAAQRTTAATLQQTVAARLAALDAQSSMYARDLRTGREVAVRADQPMNTVSVIKIPIMILAFRDAAAGRLDLDARYTIRPEDLRRGTGLLSTFAPGLQPTYRDLVTQMIVTSDNTATDIMIHRLGPGETGIERVNRMLDSLGYRETRLRMPIGQLFRGVWEQLDPKYHALTDREVYEKGFPSDPQADARDVAYVADSTRWFGRTTAREMSRLLEQLQRGELADSQSTRAMLGILRRQFYFSRLPQRIRFRAAVGHKTGDWPPIIGNDVGIIYAPSGPIVVSVFTNQNRGDFFDLEATIGRIAEDLLDAWGSARQ
jgi:beta-lactamase class A